MQHIKLGITYIKLGMSYMHCLHRPHKLSQMTLHTLTFNFACHYDHYLIVKTCFQPLACTSYVIKKIFSIVNYYVFWANFVKHSA
mgnify:CR=1 FL=1